MVHVPECGRALWSVLAKHMEVNPSPFGEEKDKETPMQIDKMGVDILRV
jgi:hypothetical protein